MIWQNLNLICLNKTKTTKYIELINMLYLIGLNA